MTSRKVLDWLLDPDEPAVRYRALVELERRSDRSSEVREARARIPEVGWVPAILASRSPEGWWGTPKNHLYQPKYISTNWQLLLLADLGVTREHPAIAQSCEFWMDRSPLEGGGVGGNSKGKGHHCFTGNMARALIQFGYGDDPRVRKAMEWLVRTAHPKGGWTCWAFGDGSSPGRTLDSWEGLSAFALYPRSKWSRAMEETVERAAEFYLGKELHLQGKKYPPWYRFHYPVHYYYDLLVGLDVLTRLGYGEDPRMRFALDHLAKKRRPDGRWNLDAVHPDLQGPGAEFYKKHPNQRPIPLTIEKVGAPSKMVTLRALAVLNRVEA